MSRFSGPQYRGASRDEKTSKRMEAELRQAEYDRQYPAGTARPRLGRKLREQVAR